jgi:uncharacterized FlaG/YvyC family protein
MDTIRTVGPIEPLISENEKSKATELTSGQAFSRKHNVRSYQTDLASVLQRIDESIDKFIKNCELHLDFKVESAGEKISVKVINKASGEVIRVIPVKPEAKMDIFKGIIYQTIA